MAGINWCKLVLRFCIFLSAAAAVAFSASASTYSGYAPDFDSTVLTNLYAYWAVTGLAALYALSVMFCACARRDQYQSSGWGWLLFLLDIAFAVGVACACWILAARFNYKNIGSSLTRCIGTSALLVITMATATFGTQVIFLHLYSMNLMPVRHILCYSRCSSACFECSLGYVYLINVVSLT